MLSYLRVPHTFYRKFQSISILGSVIQKGKKKEKEKDANLGNLR